MRILLFFLLTCASSLSVVDTIHATTPRLPASIIKLPQVRQAADYTCGPAALQAVYGAYGEDVREDQVRAHLAVNPQDGADFTSMALHARLKGYTPQIIIPLRLAHLEQLIQWGYPVICLIQAWGQKEQYHHNRAGHYVVVIGFDDEYIYVMDPSLLGHYGYIPKQEFLSRWHGETNAGIVRQLALVITPHFGRVCYRPEKLAPIE